MKTIISVDGLVAATTTEETLREWFIPFGEIVSVSLEAKPMDEGLLVGRVEYEVQEDAEAAIDNMHDAELSGRVVAVTWADTRVAFEGLGSKVPLWEQEGFIQRYLVNNETPADAMEGLEVQQARKELPVSVGPMPSS